MKGMDPKHCSENTTIFTSFLLLGFLVHSALKPLLFLLFFSIYLFSIMGNSMIVVTIATHNRLHSPMYFFLGNLSFLEAWYITTTSLTLLGVLLHEQVTISFTSCLMQSFIVGMMLSAECWLLTVMAYDRYVAICYPLHYAILMGQRLCLQLAGSAWMTSFIFSSSVIFPLSQLRFASLNVVDHYFCDLAPLLQAACSDTSLVEIDIFIVVIFAIMIPFPVIIVSYIFIFFTILNIPSAVGREKAFSTCSSHLVVVFVFFSTLITTYSIPKAGSSLSVRKVSSLLYTTATPMLNPIIYTLRNKAIREVLGSGLRWKV